MNIRRWYWAIAVATLATLAWAYRDRWLNAWWEWQGNRRWTAAQKVELEDCQLSDWMAVTRWVLQPVVPSCGSAQIGASVHAHGARLRWLEQVQNDPNRRWLVRWRASLAVRQAGGDWASESPLWVWDAEIPPQERWKLIEKLAEGEELTLGDPRIRQLRVLARLQKGELLEEEEHRALGLLLQRWSVTGEEAGFSLEHTVNLWLQQLVEYNYMAGAPDICQESKGSACIQEILDTVPRESEERPGEAVLLESREHFIAMQAFWRVAIADRALERAMVDGVTAWLDWIKEEPIASKRQLRFSLLVNTHANESQLEELADPFATTIGKVKPWARALFAMELGKELDIQVKVYSSENGMVLSTPLQTTLWESCASPRTIDEPNAKEVWPIEAVLAQATLEAAQYSQRQGNQQQAIRLGVFAERVDPVGASGFTQTIAITPLREMQHAFSPHGADADRTALAQRWANQKQDLPCVPQAPVE